MNKQDELTDSNIAKHETSLTLDTAWLLLAKTFSFITSLALPLFVVRHLNQFEFGIYKQAFLIVNTAVMLVPLGFGMSALYFLPREPEKQKQAVLNVLLFNFAVGALVCVALLAWPSVVQAIFGGPQLVPYAAALGVLILLWTMASSFDTIAVAGKEMKAASAIIVAIQLTRTSFVLAAAIFFGSVRALVMAAIVQGICQSGAFVIYLAARYPRFWGHFDWELMRRQLSYVLPLGFAGLLYMCQIDLHNYVVSSRFGPAVFAIYAIGTAQLPLVGMLQESATSVLIPRISLLQRNGQDREIVLLMARAIRKLAAAYLPIYGLLLVAGPEFIRFLFTDRYLNSWPVFAINLTLLPISIIWLDPLMRAYAGQRYFLIRVRLILAFVTMILLWLGTTYFGLPGAIGTVVIVNLTERIVIAVRFSRIMGITRSDVSLVKDAGKIAFASAVAALITAIVRSNILGSKPLIILIICGSVFAVVYLSSILILKIPSDDEKRIVLDRLMRFLPSSHSA